MEYLYFRIPIMILHMVAGFLIGCGLGEYFVKDDPAYSIIYLSIGLLLWVGALVANILLETLISFHKSKSITGL
jgi:hypothetical protein